MTRGDIPYKTGDVRIWANAWDIPYTKTGISTTGDIDRDVPV